jgi:hypothetical protein
VEEKRVGKCACEREKQQMVAGGSTQGLQGWRGRRCGRKRGWGGVLVRGRSGRCRGCRQGWRGGGTHWMSLKEMQCHTRLSQTSSCTEH